LGAVPFWQSRPGEWMVDQQVLTPDSQLVYRPHENAWRKAVKEWIQAGDAANSGGFACNTLEIPTEDLRSGRLDLRPLVLHATAPDGAACDRGNPRAQAAIANAFWQTYWATGARRAERGATFPVAFIPIDRSSSF